MTESSSGHGPRLTPSHVVLPRLAWVIVGPFALMLTGVKLVMSGGGWLTLPSLAFLVILGVMVAGRVIEQKSGFGLNPFGEPATWNDCRKYLQTVIPALFAVWIPLNVIGGLTG